MDKFSESFEKLLDAISAGEFEPSPKEKYIQLTKPGSNIIINQGSMCHLWIGTSYVKLTSSEEKKLNSAVSKFIDDWLKKGYQKVRDKLSDEF